MSPALKEAVTRTLGKDDVSFIENGDDPGISLIENARTLMGIEHVRGNLRYLLKLLGIGINGKNGRNHNGETSVSGTETIIVPGYASRNNNFTSLLERLERGGIESHALNAYEDFRFRDPFSADEASEVVCKRIEESTADRINLVCHSMGGIIALLGCQQLEQEDLDRIAKIVTLGTPWKGTSLARLLSMVKSGDRALKELSPHSKVLEKDLPQVKGEIRKKTVSIGSVADGIVPWQSSVLDGSRLNVVLRRKNAVTHANFLHAPHVAETIAEILKAA